jgi:hypothetical protein
LDISTSIWRVHFSEIDVFIPAYIIAETSRKYIWGLPQCFFCILY